MRKVLLPLLFAAIASAHSITIAWTDGINPTGTTYNVYRLVGSCPAIPPTTAPPLNGFVSLATALTGMSETDATVVAATTYCYLVTAVVSGSESAPSNTAQGIEPGSFPPTMLQVKSIE
jgi:hypothetical protein